MILNKKIFLFSTLFFLYFITIRYFGPHHNLFFAIEFVLNNNFSDDLHITNSVILNSSSYYFLFKYFLSNDFFGLFIHILISFLAIFYLYKILKTLDLQINEIIVILVGFLTLDHLIMPYVRTATAFIGQNHSSSTGLYLLFPCIYYALKNKILKYSFFMILAVTISPKLCLFSNLILISYLIYFYRNRTQNYLPVLIFLSLLLYFYFLNVDIESFVSKNEKIEAINLLFLRGSEDSINKQIWIFQITLILSILGYLFLIFTQVKSVNTKFLNLSKLIFFYSILLTICSYIYTTYLYQYLPIPKLIMLSPVRNFILFQIFLFILISIYILKSQSNNISKLLYFGSLIYWNVSYKIAIPFKFWYLPSFVFLFLGITFNFLYIYNKNIRVFFKSFNTNYLIIGTIIITLPISLVLTKERVDLFSLNSIDKIGRFYSDISAYQDLENYLFSLRNCKNFDLLVFYKKNENFTHSTSANHLSLKSSFYLDYYTMNDLKTMKLALQRDEIISNITNYLNEKKNKNNINENIIYDFIKDRQILIVIKDNEIKTINNLKNINCNKIRY